MPSRRHSMGELGQKRAIVSYSPHPAEKRFPSSIFLPIPGDQFTWSWHASWFLVCHFLGISAGFPGCQKTSRDLAQGFSLRSVCQEGCALRIRKCRDNTLFGRKVGLVLTQDCASHHRWEAAFSPFSPCQELWQTWAAVPNRPQRVSIRLIWFMSHCSALSPVNTCIWRKTNVDNRFWAESSLPLDSVIKH